MSIPWWKNSRTCVVQNAQYYYGNTIIFSIFMCGICKKNVLKIGKLFDSKGPYLMQEGTLPLKKWSVTGNYRKLVICVQFYLRRHFITWNK